MKLTAEQRQQQRVNYQTHAVPPAGTLHQISYCSKCGTAFDHARLKPCPKRTAKR